MNFGQSFLLALRSIRGNKMRAMLTMLGIIIGVAAVTVIVGLGNGMENYISDAFSSMGTNSITVNIMGRGTNRSISEEEMLTLPDEYPELLDQVSPVVSLSSTVKIGSESLSDTTSTGVGEQYLQIKQYAITEGRDLSYIDMIRRNPVCVIGSYLAQEYFSGNALGQTLKIGGNTYTVIGVLLQQGDGDAGSTDDCVYLPYTIAAKQSFTGSVTTYTYTVQSEDEITDAISTLEDHLYNVFESEDYYTVSSLTEILDTMTGMINVVVGVLAAIAAISLVVGGIGIMNIMLVSVTERTREIGIRKALGAKQRHILQQFVIEAATTSALGGIIGILIGYGLSAIASQVVTVATETEITVAPSAAAVLMAFCVSVGIGILFGYLPARKAAKLNPIDALRYE